MSLTAPGTEPPTALSDATPGSYPQTPSVAHVGWKQLSLKRCFPVSVPESVALV